MHLARVAEAETIYKQLGVRLETMTGENSLRLWLRWGRAWAYFLSQILGDLNAAEEACNSIRQRIDLQNPALEEERMYFLNAECIVEMDLGRYAESQIHNDERLKIAQARNNLKEQTAAWNVKGITSLALGDLDAACEHYEKALNISRVVGYRRGEVITLHNLGSTFADQGRWAEAIQYEEQYLSISRVTGNRLAEAYAPYTLGAIAIEQGEFVRAEALLHEGLKISEENGWPLLIEIGQLSLVNLRFYRWFEQRDPAELQEVVRQMKTFEQSPHSDQKGEFFATLALAICLAGEPEEARQVLQRARQKADESWVTDRIWLDYAEAVVNRQSCEKPVEWFRQHGLVRAVNFAERVQHAIDSQR